MPVDMRHGCSSRLKPLHIRQKFRKMRLVPEVHFHWHQSRFPKIMTCCSDIGGEATYLAKYPTGI